MTAFPMDPEALSREIEIPLQDWPGNCHGIVEAVLRRAPVPGMRLVRGHFGGYISRASVYGGGPQQHSWLELEDGRILDPTRWAMERPGKPYIYLGENDDYDEAGMLLRARGRPAVRAAAFLAGADMSKPSRAVLARLEVADPNDIPALFRAGGLPGPSDPPGARDAERLLDRLHDPVEHFRTPEAFFAGVRELGLEPLVPVDTMIRVLDPERVMVDRGANRLFEAPPAEQLTDHQRLFKIFCRFMSIEHREMTIEDELAEVGYQLDDLHEALNETETWLRMNPEKPFIPYETRSLLAVVAGELLGRGFGAELEVERYARSIGMDRDALDDALTAYGEAAGYDLQWLMPDERRQETPEEGDPTPAPC